MREACSPADGLSQPNRKDDSFGWATRIMKQR